MLKLVGFLIDIFLIAIIFLQIPKESTGISSFVAKNAAQRFLKILTVVCILVYFGIALQLNLMSS